MNRRVLSEIEPAQRIVQLTTFTVAAVLLIGWVMVDVIEKLNSHPSSSSSSPYFDSLQSVVVSFSGLSVALVIILTAPAILMMDFIGAQRRLEVATRHAKNAFGHALHNLVELLDVRASLQATRGTEQVFDAVSNAACELAKHARQTHESFVKDISHSATEAEKRSAEMVGKIIDSSGARPAFSVFRTQPDLESFYSQRLDGPYPEVNGKFGDALAREISERFFLGWNVPGCGARAADQSKQLVVDRLHSALSCDLSESVFKQQDELLVSAMEAHRAPRWKFTVLPDPDSAPNARQFVVSSSDAQSVHALIPDAQCIVDSRFSEAVVVMHATYGLPLRAFPEWRYVQAAVERPVEIPTQFAAANNNGGQKRRRH